MTPTCEIIEYTDQYHTVFKDLNTEWLERYHLMESHDVKILDDPRGTILDGGGAIYLAKYGDRIVGSAAIIKEHNQEYELAKMVVDSQYRGQGISNLLMEKCLSKARELKASKVILFSNSQLVTALKLYEKFGFRNVPVEDSPFVTADVKMELEL